MKIYVLINRGVMKNMRNILSKIFEKLLNDKKGFKIIAWIFIVLILLAIVLYPIIDANFLYYNRTIKRIEIVQRLVEFDKIKIKENEKIEKEYNNILDDMNNQSNNYISNVFREETNVFKNSAKFIAGSWIFFLAGIMMLFSKDNTTGKRFSKNNVLGAIFCLIIAIFIGYGCIKIPNIINFVVNIILYEIIIIFFAYTISKKDGNT